MARIQQLGRVGSINKVPIYLYYIEGKILPTDDVGTPFTDQELAKARLNKPQLLDYLFDNLGKIAEILHKEKGKLLINNGGNDGCPIIREER